MKEKVPFPYLSVGDLFDADGELFVKTKESGRPFHMTNSLCLVSSNIDQINRFVHINCEAKVYPIDNLVEWENYNLHKNDIFYLK